MPDPEIVPANSSLSDLLRRGDLVSAECPSRGVLKHVTSTWAVLVLIALRDGTHRFSELRRKASGVSEKCWPKPCRRWKPTVSCCAPPTP